MGARIHSKASPLVYSLATELWAGRLEHAPSGLTSKAPQKSNAPALAGYIFRLP